MLESYHDVFVEVLQPLLEVVANDTCIGKEDISDPKILINNILRLDLDCE